MKWRDLGSASNQWQKGYCKGQHKKQIRNKDKSFAADPRSETNAPYHDQKKIFKNAQKKKERCSDKPEAQIPKIQTPKIRTPQIRDTT